VEHGDRNTSAILFGEAHILGEEASVVRQVYVCEQYAFGLAGGARGVLNVRGLIGIWVGGDPVWIAEEVFPLRGIEIDNVLKSQCLPGAGFSDGMESTYKLVTAAGQGRSTRQDWPSLF
jgi:hypothetical protein